MHGSWPKRWLTLRASVENGSDDVSGVTRQPSSAIIGTGTAPATQIASLDAELIARLTVEGPRSGSRLSPRPSLLGLTRCACPK